MGLGGLIVLILGVLLPRPGLADVIGKWDWHLLADGSNKRELHWCIVFQIRGDEEDAFPRDKVDQWKKWARKAFANWVKDRSGKSTGWKFKEVDFWNEEPKPKCQIQIRWSVTPRSDFGRASVPKYKKGKHRAEDVQIYIHSVDAKGKPRKFGRKGKDTLDPVRLLKHEIGHAIRLDDTENIEDIMSSGVETEAGEIGNHDTNLSDEDYKEARESASTGLKVAMHQPQAPSAGEDVGVMVATLPVGPMVDAYVFLAVDAHDRYQDLDAAHDWLDRALELDPNNPVAARMLDQVKAEEQQVGLQRAGVALGTLQQMMIRMDEEEEHRRHEERHEGEEPGPPPEEGH
jgi:hypothetical protein